MIRRLNPGMLVFSSQIDIWASKGVFGEGIYLKRKTHPIPKHHILPTTALQIMSGLGLPIFMYGAF